MSLCVHGHSTLSFPSSLAFCRVSSFLSCVAIVVDAVEVDVVQPISNPNHAKKVIIESTSSIESKAKKIANVR
jgi:hypothetical protein